MVKHDHRPTDNKTLHNLRQANGMHVHPEGLFSLPDGKKRRFIKGKKERLECMATKSVNTSTPAAF